MYSTQPWCTYPPVAYSPNPRTLVPERPPPTTLASDELSTLYIPAYALPCTRDPVPFCADFAQAEVEVAFDSVSVGSSIIIHSRIRRVLGQSYRGTVASITHFFRDAYLFHVVGTSTSTLQPQCLLLAVLAHNTSPGWLSRIRRSLAPHSFERSYATLSPADAEVLELHVFPHHSHSRLLRLRQWHASASFLALRVVARVPGLRRAFGLPISLSTPILCPSEYSSIAFCTNSPDTIGDLILGPPVVVASLPRVE